MASPQVENGYTKISNELMEALSKINLSAYESRILWTVLRLTYGFIKKTNRISYSKFEEFTGLDRRNIARTLKSLIKRNVVIKIEIGNSIEYGIQKNYEKWMSSPLQATKKNIASTANEVLPLQATEKNIVSIDNEVLSLQTMKSLSLQTTIKEKKKILNKDSAKLKISLSQLFSEIEKDFTPEELKLKQAFLDYWTEKNPGGRKELWQMQKTFDVKKRFRRWVMNAEQWRRKKTSKEQEQSGWSMYEEVAR